MNKIKQFQDTTKVCCECNQIISSTSGHVMTMQPFGIREFRCTPCAWKNIKKVHGGRENDKS